MAKLDKKEIDERCQCNTRRKQKRAYEHAGCRGRGLLRHGDALERAPGERVGEEQVREKARRVAQLARLEAVHRPVVLAEQVAEHLHVVLVERAEALGEETVEPQVRALLRAALEDHLADLDAVLEGHVDLEQLMGALLHVQRRLDGEVDGAAQIDHVRLRFVLDLHARLLRLHCALHLLLRVHRARRLCRRRLRLRLGNRRLPLCCGQCLVHHLIPGDDEIQGQKQAIRYTG